MMWVAEDGSYGPGIVEIFDVSDWTNEDWEDWDNATDNDRLEKTRSINERKKN